MTDKIYITAEQEEAIKRHEYNKANLMHNKINGLLEHGLDEPIGKMSIEDLAKVLFGGSRTYKVLPKFKEGDIIVAEISGHKYVGSVISIQECGTPRLRLYSVHNYTYSEESIVPVSQIDHATEEEKKILKDIIIFNSSNRNLWELKENDILEYLGDLLIVNTFNSEVVNFKTKESDCLTYTENFNFVREHFNVVCFADNRKDLND